MERAVSVVAHRLTDPVITDVALHADGVRLTEMLPETMVDLFAGQDLVLLGRYQGSGPAHLRFTGRTATGPIAWTSDVTFPDREHANPFVARLWATQRIGYLEAARHKSGASQEIDTELRSLGERFGIPTELTSYLVREPAVAMTPPMDGTVHFRQDAVGPVPPAVPAPTLENSLQGKVAGGMISGAATTVASANASPAAAFTKAKAAAAERAATTLAAADSSATLAAGAAGASTGGAQHVGDRTFVLHDSVWTDTRYHEGLRLVRVQAYSPAYFALVRAVADLRSAFAVGERVLVAGGQVAVEVSPVGLTQLSDSDVAAVQSAW